MHRFVWNLRYPRPKAINYHYSIAAVWKVGTPILPMGPYVMPGRFKIILSVNGRNYVHYLDVKLDPRVKISLNNLQSQLNLAQEVQKTLNKTAAFFDSIKSKMKNDSGLVKEDSYKKLKQLSNDSANVCNILSDFASSVQTADAAPTQGQPSLYKEYKEQFDKLEKKWREFRE